MQQTWQTKLRFNSGMTLIELMVSIAIMAVIVAGAYQVYTNLQSSHNRILDRTRALNDTQRFWNLLRQDLTYALERSIRPGQDAFGGEDQSLFTLSQEAFAGDVLSFQLSRNSGLPNLVSGKPQSELRRIAYGFDDKKIYRYQWEYMDTAEDDQPVEMLMLDHVESMSIRYGYPDYEELKKSQTGSGAKAAKPGLTKSKNEWHWVEFWPLEAGNTLGSSQQGMNSLSETNNLNGTNNSNQGNNSNTASLASKMPLLPSVIEITLETEIFGTLVRVFEIGAPDAHAYATMLQNIQAPGSLPEEDSNTENKIDPDAATENSAGTEPMNEPEQSFEAQE